MSLPMRKAGGDRGRVENPYDTQQAVVNNFINQHKNQGIMGGSEDVGGSDSAVSLPEDENF